MKTVKILSNHQSQVCQKSVMFQLKNPPCPSVFTKIKPSKFAGFDSKILPNNFQVSKLRIQTKIYPFIHSVTDLTEFSEFSKLGGKIGTTLAILVELDFSFTLIK
jgi:hypothetical protein